MIGRKLRIDGVVIVKEIGFGRKCLGFGFQGSVWRSPGVVLSRKWMSVMGSILYVVKLWIVSDT